MATIETRTTPEGKTSYRVTVCIHGFPSQSVTLKRKRDAQKLAGADRSRHSPLGPFLP